jgi:FKBP-type peptidyl-prolyl cis-trans isomerase
MRTSHTGAWLVSMVAAAACATTQPQAEPPKPAEAHAPAPEPHAEVVPAQAAHEPAADPNAPADVAAAPADADRTPSGLASKVLTPGTGQTHPKAEDTVKVHYTGWMSNGVKFDSSLDRGQPAEFPLNTVIKGWTEAVQLMVEGEKRRVWIPGVLAYGDTPQAGRPSGTLVFDVELLHITPAPEVTLPPLAAAAPPPPPPAVPAVPEDVSAPPKDAKVTKSGLAYRVLQPGTGSKHPTTKDTVEVHYTGWTTDGKMFDSSVARGETAKFPLRAVIPGWTEGVQLMVVGEKTRFWIPGKLAYGDSPKQEGAPAGMLVFDVELVNIGGE